MDAWHGVTTVKIYTFELLDVGPGSYEVEMPSDAQILSMDVRRNKICLWALVDPKAKLCTRTFRRFVTGAELSSEDVAKMHFWKTCLLHDDDYVVHVFEEVS